MGEGGKTGEKGEGRKKGGETGEPPKRNQRSGNQAIEAVAPSLTLSEDGEGTMPGP